MKQLEVIRYLKRCVRLGSWPLLQRYLVANKIFALPPIELDTKSDFCVHVYLCENHALMLHWALRSLYHHSSGSFRVMVHDDGSCAEKTRSNLLKSFVGLEFIRRRQAAERIMPLLNHCPHLQEWWPTNSRSVNVKWLDAYLLGDSKYIVFLDPDILFFADPKALFREESKTVWMEDCAYMLEIPSNESVRLFGGNPLLPINAGLGRMERSRFNLGLAEKVLIELQKPRDDMTMHAVISAQAEDVELLPKSYRICPYSGLNELIAKHYTSPFRFEFFEEGIPRIARHLKLPLGRWLRERA